MKIINIFVLILFSSVFSFSQTTYYISSSNGNDSNNGTSELNPWKTIKKVNSIDLKAGDNVLFKAGDFWVGEPLLIKNSGTSGNRITYSYYGIGSKPIITLQEEIDGWKSSTNWKVTSGLINVWEMDFNCQIIFDRMWLNGKEAKLASYIRLRTDKYAEQPGANGSYPNGIYIGDNLDGTTGVCEEHQFYWHPSSGKLYLYSPENPANFYTSIQFPGKTANETVSIINANYVLIDGLDIQGGLWAALAMRGCRFITITNCNIGKNTNYKGIYGAINNSSGKTTENIVLSNNNIESNWIYDYIFYTKRTPQGIHIESGSSNWEIFDNYIKDWWMNILVAGVTAPSQYFSIHNNEFTSPNFNYGKAIQISSGGIWNTPPTYVKFYNNFIHNICSGIQLSASGNKFYYNIFKDLTMVSTNSHGPNDGGYMVQVVRDVQNERSENNSFFNNTCFNLREPANFGNSENSVYLNNLFIDCGLTRSGISSYISQNRKVTYNNNLFYHKNTSKGHKFIYKYGGTTYSIDEWNNQNGNDNKVIYDNFDYYGPLSSLINTNDLTLPSNSPAINAGIDISFYIPEGFKDRFGNVVDRKSPNIGAVGSSVVQDQGGGEAGENLKVFLEAAYNNGLMRTAINSLNFFPKEQPYKNAPWNLTNNVEISEIKSNYVDWVLVELRSDLINTKYRKSAILTTDGTVLNPDGTGFSFRNIASNSYYLVVSHRNHLSVMSSRKVDVTKEKKINYDFTNSLSSAYGTNSLVNLGNGKFGMISGDANADNTINNLDFGAVANNIPFKGYTEGDLDMNGIINVLDYTLINKNILKASNVPK